MLSTGLQPHMKNSQAAKPPWFHSQRGWEPETCEARPKGAKLFATYCFPCCPVALGWQARAGRARACPCSAARWFTHQDMAEPKASSSVGRSWGCFSITIPSHGSWTALAKAQLLDKQQLPIYSCIKPGTIGPSPNASIYTLTKQEGNVYTVPSVLEVPIVLQVAVLPTTDYIGLLDNLSDFS